MAFEVPIIHDSVDVLIVGAGPVGLAGALFAHDSGQQVQIVERLITPTKESKALAVNPRTLELLQSSGVTEVMLQKGIKIHGAQLWHENGTKIGDMIFAHLHSRFPYMLALSQAATERLLAEALEKRGLQVLRGLEVTGCENLEAGVRTHFRGSASRQSRYLLAADGAHSIVRQSLGVSFAGSSLAAEWHLVDVPMKTEMPEDRAHVIFREGEGFCFMVRVVEDRQNPPPGDPVWRVITTWPEPLKKFKFGQATGVPEWSSHFHVNHRICESLQADSVFFAGDAAHLHSPVGARGMNLGIEDAWVFAKLLHEGRLDQYDDERRVIDKAVVRKIDFLSRLVLGDQIYLRALRDFILPEFIKIPPLRQMFARSLSGLDHQA